jgi:hypothetical protein
MLMIPLVVLRVATFTESESGMVVTRDQREGGRRGEFRFSGYRESAWNHGKVLEMDNTDGCT